MTARNRVVREPYATGVRTPVEIIHGLLPDCHYGVCGVNNIHSSKEIKWRTGRSSGRARRVAVTNKKTGVKYIEERRYQYDPAKG